LVRKARLPQEPTLRIKERAIYDTTDDYQPPLPTARATNPLLVVALLIGQLVIAIILCVLAVFNAFAVDGCARGCDYALSTFAAALTPIAAVITLVGAIVISILRHRRNRSSWWAPVIGVVLVAVAFLVSSGLTVTATNPL
jgi:hypothetical protein